MNLSGALIIGSGAPAQGFDFALFCLRVNPPQFRGKRGARRLPGWPDAAGFPDELTQTFQRVLPVLCLRAIGLRLDHHNPV
jgi:hypothetical protein